MKPVTSDRTGQASAIHSRVGLREVLPGWFGSGSRAAWVLLCTLLCATLPMFFSWPRVPVRPTELPRWERYWNGIVQVKIDHLLYDYRRDFPPGTNEAKRNFRLTMPLLGASPAPDCRVFTRAAFFCISACWQRSCWPPSAPAMTAERRSPRRSPWLAPMWERACGAIFPCGSTTAPTPHCTDERSLLAVPLLLAFHVFTNGRRSTLFGIGAAVPAYLLLRLALAKHLGFLPPIAGIADVTTIATNLKVAPLVYWFALEGGWLIVAIALTQAATAGSIGRQAALAFAALLPIVAATAVGDFTRSASYGFPAVFAALALWHSSKSGNSAGPTMIRPVACAALASLLIPNVTVMKEIVMEQSLPVHVLMSWLQTMAQ